MFCIAVTPREPQARNISAQMNGRILFIRNSPVGSRNTPMFSLFPRFRKAGRQRGRLP
jgi:hypothetical protein